MTTIVLGSVFGVPIVTAGVLHASHITTDSSSGNGHLPNLKSLHTTPYTSDGTITIKLNEPEFAVCGQPFFDSVYQFTKNVFEVGADNVVLSEYEDKIFALIRSGNTFKGDAEAFIEHIKAIPQQTIDIVKEDPEVLDSCDNFQIAMVGPP